MLRLEAADGTVATGGFRLTGVRVEGATLSGETITTSPVLLYAINTAVLRWTKASHCRLPHTIDWRAL